jgi:hypothetical protein
MKPSPKLRERILLYGKANLPHELGKEPEIVDGIQPGTQHLFHGKDVM